MLVGLLSLKHCSDLISKVFFQDSVTYVNKNDKELQNNF